MSTSPYYCSHCGAANEAESQFCFACQRPFALHEEQDDLLNGRYQILTQVGSGGFGGVYRALDTAAESRRVVAIKQIYLRGLAAREVIEATDGFNREVRLLTTLRHPNLPVIHDTFIDPENWYLVMDFIEGETLEAYLKGKGSLPLKEVLKIGLQLCTVLDFLHTRQPVIVFRDLKPGNVMRTSSGHIYLIDFGIARHFSPGKPRDTAPFGSPGYAAPEQYGKAQTTPQADIYSLGALLHHLLTGSDPAESPFRFAPLPDTEPAELDTLLQRMLAKEPGERPASIIEVRTALQGIRLREYQTHFADVPPVPVQAPAPPSVTRRGVLIAAGTVVAMGGVVGLCSLVTSFVHPMGGIAAFPPPPSPGTAKKQFIYRGHKGPITAVSWSPDGRMVASGSSDGTVQVWRASDGALLYTLSGYYNPVTAVVWATNRTNVIASAGDDDGTVQVWDALRDHRDLVYHGDGRVLALDWKRKSPWMVSGGTDTDIYTWNASTGAKGVSYRGHKGNVNTVVWLPDTLSFTTPGVTGLSGPGILSTPGTAVATPVSTVAPPESPELKKVIASGGADGTVQVWNANTGRSLLVYRGHKAAVNGLAVLSSSSSLFAEYIASASDDGTVHVWRTPSGSLNNIYHGHNGRVNAVAVPADTTHGQQVASAGEDSTVQVWMIFNNELLSIYKGHQASIKALAASPVDNRMVSGDSAGLVHLWTITYPSR